MLSARTRSRLARLHRWLALALSPVIATILVSGIVLAFRPPADDSPASGKIDVRRVLAIADSVDPQHHTRVIAVDPDSNQVGIGVRGQLEIFDLATGRHLPSAKPQDPPSGPFDIALRVHKGAWFAGDLLVSLGSIAMVFLVIAGPILSRPSRGRTMLSRHILLGWLLWPLVALLPLSLVAMKLHGAAAFGSGRPVSPEDAIAVAAKSVDVSQLALAQSFPRGAFLLTSGRDGLRRYVVRDGAVHRLDTRLSIIGQAVHEGTWAGRWSGALNALAALVTLTMLGTGMYSWVRRGYRV